jgi:ankyrin repeat protein
MDFPVKIMIPFLTKVYSMKKEKRIYDEISRRVFEKSDFKEKQYDEQIREEATIKALSEVSGLSPDEVMDIAEKVKYEFKEKQLRRPKRIKTIIIGVLFCLGVLGIIYLPMIICGIVSLFQVERVVIARDEDHNAFMDAVEAGNLMMINYLLDKGISVNTGYYGDITALMVAVENKQLEVVKLLLERGADVLVENEYGYTALTYAHLEEDTALINLISRACVQVLPQGHPIIKLWEMGVPYTFLGLIEAIEKDNTDAVELFLKSSMLLSLSDFNDRTPLTVAVSLFQNDIVAKFLKQRDRITEEDAINAFMLAASINNVEVMDMLLTWGLSVETKTSDGTALIYAAKANMYDAVKFLIENGADVNVTIDDDTPLILTTDYDIMKILLENGADKTINVHGSSYITAIYAVAYELYYTNNPAEQKKKIALLLEYGADPTPVCYERRSAIDIARVTGYYDIVRLMEEYAKENIE